eukprot:s250_g1.t1
MREKLVTLKTEVQLLKLVDHPHIVMLHEIFEDNDDVHLVMSLCRGGHLQAYVMRYGRLKEKSLRAAGCRCDEATFPCSMLPAPAFYLPQGPEERESHASAR